VAVLASSSSLGYLVAKGASSLDWSFFVKIRPSRPGGWRRGERDRRDRIIVGLAALIGLPIGIGTGLYLADTDRAASLDGSVRRGCLNGTPSSSWAFSPDLAREADGPISRRSPAAWRWPC